MLFPAVLLLLLQQGLAAMWPPQAAWDSGSWTLSQWGGVAGRPFIVNFSYGPSPSSLTQVWNASGPGVAAMNAPRDAPNYENTTGKLHALVIVAGSATATFQAQAAANVAPVTTLPLSGSPNNRVKVIIGVTTGPGNPINDNLSTQTAGSQVQVSSNTVFDLWLNLNGFSGPTWSWMNGKLAASGWNGTWNLMGNMLHVTFKAVSTPLVSSPAQSCFNDFPSGCKVNSSVSANTNSQPLQASFTMAFSSPGGQMGNPPCSPNNAGVFVTTGVLAGALYSCNQLALAGPSYDASGMLLSASLQWYMPTPYFSPGMWPFGFTSASAAVSNLVVQDSGNLGGNSSTTETSSTEITGVAGINTQVSGFNFANQNMMMTMNSNQAYTLGCGSACPTSTTTTTQTTTLTTTPAPPTPSPMTGTLSAPASFNVNLVVTGICTNNTTAIQKTVAAQAQGATVTVTATCTSASRRLDVLRRLTPSTSFAVVITFLTGSSSVQANAAKALIIAANGTTGSAFITAVNTALSNSFGGSVSVQSVVTTITSDIVLAAPPPSPPACVNGAGTGCTPAPTPAPGRIGGAPPKATTAFSKLFSASALLLLLIAADRQ